MTNLEYKKEFRAIYDQVAQSPNGHENFTEKVKEAQKPLREQYISECKFFVTMTDSFLSGWGRAEGLTNKYIVCCRTLNEALTVKENAQKRNEMKYINVRSGSKVPYYSPNKFLVSLAIVPEMGEIWVNNLNDK